MSVLHKKPIQNLKQVLDLGYKILGQIPEQFYGFEVELNEKIYKQKLNSSIVLKKDMSFWNQSNFAYWHSSKRKNKYMTISTPYYAERNKLEIQKNIREGNREKGVECHVVPQTFGSSFSFWEIYMVNRYWITETILRTQAGGLDVFWKRWHKYVDVVYLKLAKESGRTFFNENGPDIISLGRILPVMALCLILFGCSLVTMVVELCYGKKHELFIYILLLLFKIRIVIMSLIYKIIK